jgi:hypothetical protein
MNKIAFIAKCGVPDAGIERNRQHSRGLGLPEVGFKPVAKSLAVVGGGPSISGIVKELQEFDGDIWAINGTYHWCIENGIDAIFYAIDPHETVIAGYAEGVTKAVVADCVDKSVFEALSGADVELAHTGINDILHDTTAASTAPMIAVARGHESVTFYGCESCFSNGTHAYKDDRDEYTLLWVECGGKEYTTTPQFIMQAEFMAEMARSLPTFMQVPGEGFLQALIEHGDYKVTYVSQEIETALKEAS